MKITKASYLLCFFNKSSTSVLFLEFRYFYIPSPIRIPIFSGELSSSLIDSGANLVLSSYMVRFSCSVEQRKQIYSCEVNSFGVVWCGVAMVYNKQTNRLRVYRHLLTNHLHGKAAELCLANS